MSNELASLLSLWTLAFCGRRVAAGGLFLIAYPQCQRSKPTSMMRLLGWLQGNICMPGTPLIRVLLLMLMLLLLQLISSKTITQDDIKSSRLFELRNVQVASKYPSVFDGGFVGLCVFAFGFSDPDDTGSKKCVQSNSACQQQYSVEYYDAGKDTGFPGAVFSRGFYDVTPTCVAADATPLMASNKSRETNSRDLMLFSPATFVLASDSKWFSGFPRQPPSGAKFSAIKPVKEWPPCSCEDSGCECKDGDNVLPLLPNLFSNNTFLAYTDGTDYWEFGVLDSDMALWAPGVDATTGVAIEGSSIVVAPPFCSDEASAVTYQCHATKQAQPTQDPDFEDGVENCLPFPAVCKFFSKPDKNGALVISNPAYPDAAMVLNATLCLPLLASFAAQSKTSDANTMLRDYLNTLSVCFDAKLSPCLGDAVSYLRGCGCLDDDSLSAMIDTFCGDSGAGDASDGGFAAFAPSEDGNFDDAALEAFSKCADPDLAKELATRAGDPDKYGELPSGRDKL